MRQIVFVPIDNRPVTYTYPLLVARIAGIDALLPPRQIMGSLVNDAHVDDLQEWLLNTLAKNSPEAALVCADSIIYGGLIPSRRVTIGLSMLVTRAKVLSRLKRMNPQVTAVYAQSSIMRIADNYDNTEEKAYWTRYGRELFAWSETLHRLQIARANPADDREKFLAGRLQQLEARIEPGVRDDYMSTRQRNFKLNKQLIDFVESEAIDWLVFSQDDSGQYGLNVLEKELLLAEAERRRLPNVVAYAGADEVLCTMLGRWLLAIAKKRPVVAVSYCPSSGGGIMSRYEGQTIGDSVRNQLAAVGLVDTVEDVHAAELRIIIHTGGHKQGDHIWLTGLPDEQYVDTKSIVEQTVRLIESSAVPVVLCDVAYANGADPALVEALLDRQELMAKLWAYAGWNTTGNTLGSAFATGVARWFAQQTNVPAPDKALKDALLVRFADDWAYQSTVRSKLTNGSSSDELRTLMSKPLERIQAALGHKVSGIAMRLPWQRTFEIEVKLPDSLQALR